MKNSKLPSLPYRENFLRVIEFRVPEFIPYRIHVSWPVWNIYRDKLEKLTSGHPLIFRGFKRGSIEYRDEPRILRSGRAPRDPFGCVWVFPIEGLQGQVIKHPLSDWSRFKDFRLPDPEEGVPIEGGGLIPWSQVYEGLERAVVGNMPHAYSGYILTDTP